MLNYFPNEVCIGLQEIPQEISLIVPLAGCGHNCLDCHSPHYQIATNGEELTVEKFKELLDKFLEVFLEVLYRLHLENNLA